jgi:hypothetical protein
VSEYIDADHDSAELEHEAYGEAQEHDQAFHGVHDQQAAEHDVAYQHGQHVEVDTPAGGHYEETEFTNYAEHEAAASEFEKVDFAEHDASEAYAEKLFAAEDHQSLESFVSGHELQGVEQHELGHQAEGHEGHVGKAEQAWVEN